MQDSLPAGALRLYREGVDPLGHDERFQVTSVLLSRAFPDASWAHCRRKLFDVFEATASPLAKQALDRVADLFDDDRYSRTAPIVRPATI
jgi:hypothetical protein